MANFDLLKLQLARYRALAHHTDTRLNARVMQVQQWQKERMKALHSHLFSQENHVLMTQYFMNRLYGGADFDILASQFERILEKANKIEKYAPTSAIETGNLGVELSVLAIELDEQLAVWCCDHIADDVAINAEVIRQAYLETQQFDARIHQMALLDTLGDRLDKYVRSFMIQTAFKMARGSARKHNFMPIYDFMGEGFSAMKPIKSAKSFVGIFTEDERKQIKAIYSDDPFPFVSAV